MKILMIMPFDKAFDDVYVACESAVEEAKQLAKDAINHPRVNELQDIELYRVDEGHGAVDIMEDLLHHMREASLCIADISGNNPNVLWELGYAMALEKPVIIVSQEIEKAPFDVASFRKLPYDRGNLGESLVGPLANQISGVFRELPEVTAFPDELGFARTLAMSISSPAYFLDSDFNIRYMNEAAVAIFLADTGQSTGSWIKKSLVSFMNEFANRLKNLTEIERNLQIQKEKLWRNGESAHSQPLNVERIVLDTVRYGIVEMQKTGIAVRNVNDNRIVGWVVSFNCIKSDAPERLELYHDTHKAILENQVLCSVVTRKEERVCQDDIPRWKNFSMDQAEFDWASDYSEKQTSFEFMAKIMTSDKDRYGLSSVEYLTDIFFDYKNSEYLRLSCNGDIVALLRLHKNHNLRLYPDLDEDICLAIEDGQSFADAGIYFPIGTPSEQRLRLLGILLGNAAEKVDSVNLYAQVPKRLLSRYQEFGFAKAGKPFSCAGWQGQWCPIWVNNWHFAFAETLIAKEFRASFEMSRSRFANTNGGFSV